MPGECRRKYPDSNARSPLFHKLGDSSRDLIKRRSQQRRGRLRLPDPRQSRSRTAATRSGHRLCLHDSPSPGARKQFQSYAKQQRNDATTPTTSALSLHECHSSRTAISSIRSSRRHGQIPELLSYLHRARRNFSKHDDPRLRNWRTTLHDKSP